MTPEQLCRKYLRAVVSTLAVLLSIVFCACLLAGSASVPHAVVCVGFCLIKMRLDFEEEA